PGLGRGAPKIVPSTDDLGRALEEEHRRSSPRLTILKRSRPLAATGRRRAGRVGSLELDDAADDLALLAGFEGFVDIGEVDALGDHAFEVELAVAPELQELVEVRA